MEIDRKSRERIAREIKSTFCAYTCFSPFSTIIAENTIWTDMFHRESSIRTQKQNEK
tara:strand:+ start:30 stop:200 length:171 start_codon:yes stop_codon:yes gene_type:complete